MADRAYAFDSHDAQWSGGRPIPKGIDNARARARSNVRENPASREGKR